MTFDLFGRDTAQRERERERESWDPLRLGEAVTRIITLTAITTLTLNPPHPQWMGYFLLRESMLDSLIRARDRMLKPGGCMFPSQAVMFFGIVSCEEERVQKLQDLDQVPTTNRWYLEAQ